MKDASPWIALYAALVATGSAVWQLANFALTGGRVKIKLRAGAMNSSSTSMITMPPSGLTPQAMTQWQAQGYPRPIVAVEIANVGRQPITVAKWSLKHASGAVYMPMDAAIGKPLPCRLEVGESETWAVDLKIVYDAVQATETVLPKGGRGVRGAVELADGRSRRTKETLHLT